MKIESQYSRDQIKRRILRRISQLWDVESIDHIDPIVSLLAESMAEEIFMLSAEVSNLDDRLLSKLSTSLLPTHYLTARPSHGILSAMPTESRVRLDHDTIFAYKESKVLRKYNVNHIELTPIIPFTLIKAQIKYLNICGQIYKCAGGFKRNTLAYAQKTNRVFNNSLWIAIEADDDIDNLSNLALYFDFSNIQDKYKYLKLLEHSKWSVGGVAINVISGLNGDQTEKQTANQYERLSTGVIYRDIKAMYDIHYVSLPNHTCVRSNFPEELNELYSESDKHQFNKPLFWIRVDFPHSVHKETIEDIRVGINMFPVANISRKKISETMIDVSLFIPLETDKNEYFMEIESVKDSLGKVYIPLSVDNAEPSESNNGYYSLRTGGVEQYSNTNDARSSAMRLADILRDRNLFSSNRTEAEFNQLISDTVNSINKISSAMEALGEKPQPKSYLLVYNENPRETLFVDYLTTNGASINKFKPDTPLASNSGSVLEADQTLLITAMRSGQDAPPRERINDRHRYLLTSHDRIFTKHDIVNFCMAEYGNDIETINIRQGSTISMKPKEGIVKTIDVFITLKQTSHLKISIETMKTDMLCKLEQRSPDSFNYQLFLN